MPLEPFKINQGEAKVYPPMPDDVYQVELFDITAKVVDDKYNEGQKQTVLSFQFVILDDGEYRGRSIWRDYVPIELYIGKKGKNLLYQIIEAIICRPLSQEQVESMDSDFLNKMIGYQCRVTVKTQEKEGSKRNFIESFLPKKMSLTRLTDEEKAKCVVKQREESDHVTDDTLKQSHSASIPDDEIPTINLDDEEEVVHSPEAPAEEKPKVTDVPF